ncbi:GFA family protein [Marinobacter sp. X15-166B]|uniref:GFA family protein n=1 Tax=Marinobacter sp. X15-166B TaxID=1897620 RepID=UPI00085C5D4C|nr:GFA family protein [Marinobacter sp. X15-166B]OEY67508.1 alanine acetyltransferase [Marinobacter sp. X15-166B]
MQLAGSCHCGSVRFTLDSPHPYPFNLCYCSICRKTAGGGGFAINLGGDYATLAVEGEKFISVYQAVIPNANTGEPQQSPGQRHFCKQCGSALWLWDPRWPELVHPFASAIDTDLPVPPERTHMMLESKASWVNVQTAPHDTMVDEYPRESLAAWHRRLGLEDRNS